MLIQKWKINEHLYMIKILKSIKLEELFDKYLENRLIICKCDFWYIMKKMYKTLLCLLSIIVVDKHYIQ